MATNSVLMREMETVPEQLVDEIIDFIRFVKSRAIKEGVYTAIASESSLKKDWLCAEEDEAWADL